MRVKIGDQVYDPGVLPIIIQLSPEDKLALAQLPEGDDVWCVHPTGYPQEELQRLMSTLPPVERPPLSVVPDGTDTTVELPSSKPAAKKVAAKKAKKDAQDAQVVTPDATDELL